MPDPRRLTVFISSPSDVEAERVAAERVVKRLDRAFSAHASLRAVRWEREPLRATRHFQEEIPAPSATDIVIVILWSRLGTPLRDDLRGAISGKVVTGTEYEFEDALDAARGERGRPDLLVFRKEGVPSFRTDAEVLRYVAERPAVDAFFDAWFKEPGQGSLKAAWRTFSSTAQFEEMLDEQLPELVRRQLGVSREESAPRIEWYEGSPFRGLETFEIQHAPIFFGRTRARHELREQLVRQVEAGRPWVVVLGSSGSGKSSLVKAGLIPDIITPGLIERVGLCRFAIMRPSDEGADLLAGLSRALLSETALPELAELKYDAARLREMLGAGHGQASLPVEQGLEHAGQAQGVQPHAVSRLALVIDQLEELFLADPERSGRAGFLAALDGLAASGLVWIVATLRGDFLRELEANRVLADRFDGGARFFLAAPSESELRQIITRPAEAAGLSFETDPGTEAGLDEAIAAAARIAPGSLPLLEYLLDQLWQRRDDGRLTWSAYRELGGLEGAIGSRAEAVFQSLPVEAREALPRVLRALVTIAAPEDDARPAAQWVPLDRFPEGSPARVLVEALLDREARLLVVDQGANVRVAHEALLSHWARAVEQIREDATDLNVWARLRAQARRWTSAETDDRASLLLPAGLPLSEAERLLARRAEELDAPVLDYIAASREAREAALAEERRRQASLRDAVRMAAVRQVGDDTARRAALLREFEDPGHAHGWMAAASEAARTLAWHAALPASTRDHVQYDCLALSRDGSVLVARGVRETTDTPFVVWRVGWIGEPAEWLDADATVSKDGHVAPLSRGDASMRAYRVLPGCVWLGLDADDRLVRLLADTTLTVDRIDVGDDLHLEGRLDTVEGDADRTSWVRQRATLQPVRRVRPAGPVAPARSADAAEGYLASVHADGTVFTWRLGQDAALVRSWVMSEGMVRISPDGQSVILKDRKSGSVMLARPVAGQEGEVSIHNLGQDIRALEFSADGAWFVSAHEKGPVRVHRTSDPSMVFELRTGGVPPTAVAFAPDGRVLTGETTGTLLWPFAVARPQDMSADSSWPSEAIDLGGGFVMDRDLVPPDQPVRRRYARCEKPRRLVTSPDGRRLVAISTDGTAILACLDGPEGVHVLGTPQQPCIQAVFSGDGRWVATVGRLGGPRVWRADGMVDPIVLGPPPGVRGVGRLAVEAGVHGETLWTQFGWDEVRKSRTDGTGPSETVRFRSDQRLRTSSSSHSDPDLRWTCEQMEGEEVRLFPIRSGRAPFVLRGVTEPLRVEVAADESRVVGVTETGAVFLWSVADLATPRRLGQPGGDASVAAFSPDGRSLAIGTTSGAVFVWKGDGTGEPTPAGTLDEPVESLTFSVGGEWLLAEAYGGRAMVAWTSGSGATDLGRVEGVRFIGAGPAVLKLYSDAAAEVAVDGSFRILRRFPRPLGNVEQISPDGRWLLAGRRDELLFWATSGDLGPVPIPDVGTQVTATACSPDGNRLLTGHGDGSVRIWSVDLDPRSLVERLWRATPYCLTIEERRTLLAEDPATARAGRKVALDTAYRYHADSLGPKVAE